MTQIVIAEFMDEAAVMRLKNRFQVVYDPELVDQRPKLLGLLQQAAALIVRNRTQVDRELLAAAPALSVVGRLGVGLDNIDVQACRDQKIEVIPATGANALAVAEYVIATAMLLLRGAYVSSHEVAAGQWPRNRLSAGREIAGKTLGLIGFGGIGQLTAKLAQGMGMQVMAHDPMLDIHAPLWGHAGVRPASLDTLLAGSDVVSLHIPLTAQTRGLLNHERLLSMKKEAVLINTARGGIVDEAALAALLKAGHLAGAALDVFDAEPVTAASGAVLADIPNLLLTPHIAGVSFESNERVSTLIAERVAGHLAA